MTAFSLRVHRLRRRDDDGVTFAARQRFNFLVAAGRNGFLMQSGDARCVQLLYNEFDEGVIEPTVPNKTNLFSCQLLAAVYSRSSHNKLLVDSSGEENQVRFAFEIRPQWRRRRQVAELNLA